jgi:RHS repeat-associated protein
MQTHNLNDMKLFFSRLLLGALLANLVSISTFGVANAVVAPGNDNKENATTISTTNWCSPLAGYTTIDATADGPTHPCNSTARSNVWFKFLATTSYIRLDVKTGSSEGTIGYPEVALWSSTFAPVGCKDNANTSADVSIEKFDLTPGQWYYFSVYNSVGSTGTFSLCANDQITPLSSKNNWTSALAAYSNATATSDGPVSECASASSKKSWFKFQAATPYIRFDVKTGSTEGTIQYPEITLWDDAFNAIGCRNYVSMSGDNSLEYFDLENGKSYYLSVHNGLGNEGTYTLTVNDQIPLITQTANWCSALAAYSNVNATADGPASSCGGNSEKKSWFKFQAGTPYIRIDVKTGSSEGTIQYPEVALWNEDLSTATCKNNTSSSGDVILEKFDLAVGRWYYICVYNNSGADGTFSLCINDQIQQITQKNNWCSALAAYTNVNASTDGPVTECGDASDKKTWFKFQAATSYIRLDVKTGGTEGTIGYPEMALYKSDFTPVSCRQYTGSSGDVSIEKLDLVENETYYVAVYNASGSTGTFTLCANDQIQQITQKSNWSSTLAAYSNVSSTTDGPISSCGSANDKKTWFKFNASTSYLKFDVKTGGSEGTIGYPEIALFKSNMSPVHCKEYTGSSGDVGFEQFDLVEGQDYYICVYNATGSAGTFSLSVNDQITQLTQKNNWTSALAAYSNVNGTIDGPVSTCGQASDKKTWFKFQANTPYIKIDVKTGSTEGTIGYPEISLYKNNMTAVACKNYVGSASDVVLERFDLTVGQTYYIAVNNGAGSPGTFTLGVNDQLAELTNKNNWTSALAAYTNVNGSTDGSTSTCGSASDKRTWFKVQATTPYLKVDVKTGGTEGTLEYPEMALFKSDFTLIACKDYTGSSGDIFLDQLDMVPGETYYVSVYNGNGNPGTFTLGVTDQIPELTNKNNWSSALAAYSNVNGTTAGPVSTCGVASNKKSWFKIQAATSYLRIDVKTGSTEGTIDYPEIALYRANFTQVACKPNGGTSSSDVALERLDLTVGETYYIAVYNRSGSTGTYTLAVNDQISTLSNKNNWCSGLAAFNMANATTDGPTSICGSANDGRMWFKLESATPYIKIDVKTGSSEGSITYPEIALWSDTFTEITGVNNSTSSGDVTLEKVDLQQGHTYYVSVFSNTGSSGTFTLCVSDQMQQLAQLNDWCSAAAAYTNVLATTAGPASSCGGVTFKKKWFKFQSLTGYLKLDVKTGDSDGTIDYTEVAIWNDDFTPVTCKRATEREGDVSIERMNLVEDKWYYISVSSAAGDEGSFKLCATDQTVYDHKVGAKVLDNLDFISANAAYDNLNTSPDGPAGGCGNYNNVWFKFKPTRPYIKIEVKTGSPEGSIRYPEISLFNSAGTEVDCKDYSGSSYSDVSLERSNLSPGQWYYISVHTRHPEATYQGTFTLSITDINCALVPSVFDVTAAPPSCVNQTARIVTLADTELDITYTLNNSQDTPGTGEAISWGNLNEGTYTVRAKKGRCTPVVMETVELLDYTVNTYTVSGTSAICAGDNATVTLSDTQAKRQYQLVHEVNGVSSNIGSPRTGTGSQMTWAVSAAGKYTVTASHPTGGCPKVMTGNAVITHNALPTVFSVTGTKELCTGETTNVKLSSSTTGITYTLYRTYLSLAQVVMSKPGTGYQLIFDPISAIGTYSVKAVNNTTGCFAWMSGSASITATEIAAISGPSVLQEGGITLQGNTTSGFTYKWKRDGDIISGQTTSSLLVKAPGTYTLVLTKGTCETTAEQFVASPKNNYYNGLISSVRWRTDKAYEVQGADFKGMYIYTYDDRDQLKSAEWAIPNPAFTSYTQDKTKFGSMFRTSDMTYDPNGNIKTLRRFDDQGTRKDKFDYEYGTHNNKLDRVTGYGSMYYNSIGQITSELKENEPNQYISYDITGKVIMVHSAVPKTEANRVVGYIYDDRGFRLAQVDYPANKTTWYIRDASGNITSIYEQPGVPAPGNANAIVQKEVPVYGASKLGVYYPDAQVPENGSTNYEITDHLGNVRAIVRDNVKVYTATMEDNGLAEISNPRVEEGAYFENLFETEKTDQFMNVTKPSPPITNPDQVAYLYWNDTQGTTAQDKAVGPALAKEVKKGDRIELETYARYEEKTSFAKDFQLTALSSLLGNTFASLTGFEANASTISSNLLSGLVAAGYQNDDTGTDRPFAYLNYILYDANLVMKDAGWIRIPEVAGSDPSALYLPANKPVRLAFEEAIPVNQDGYIYAWVSNQSRESKVWFDNIRVSHAQPIAVQATDYGAWGDVIREQKTDERLYRFGYQGQFSEFDAKTGLNHFKRREYNPTIARWLTTDPKGQFWSPYAALGNNAVSNVDVDGAFAYRWQAWLWAKFNGGGDVEQANGGAYDGEWYVGNQVDAEGGIGYNRVFRSGYQLDFKLEANFSVGPQIGEYISNVEGLDLTLASFSFFNFKVEGAFGDLGFTGVKSEIIPIWEDSKITHKIGIDLPGCGGSIQRTLMKNDPTGTASNQIEYHYGLESAGIKHTYDLDKPTEQVTLSGSAGAKFLLGVEADYDFGITKLK